jgi:uncharacterized protein
MTTDKIRYDLLVQNALKAVLRKVLGDVAKEGLPGEHHFFISFQTEAPGVRISSRMKEKYPDEMTIVLQHQFWDLSVTEHTFEVGLSFSGIPERLLIPFDAITAFFDPSVQFGLKFEVGEIDDQDLADSMNDTLPSGDSASNDTVKKLRPLRAVKNGDDHSDKAQEKLEESAKKAKKSKTVKKSEDDLKSDSKSDLKSLKDASKANVEDAKAEAGNAASTVVSLDAFRRKAAAPSVDE